MAEWWCGIMASMKALSKGSRFANCWGSIMPIDRSCSWLISIGTFEVPNSSCFIDFSSSISACCVETMFRESSFISSCSACLRATWAISIAPWWWGTIASTKALSEYLPFSISIPEAMPPRAVVHTGHTAGLFLLAVCVALRAFAGVAAGGEYQGRRESEQAQPEVVLHRFSFPEYGAKDFRRSFGRGSQAQHLQEGERGSAWEVEDRRRRRTYEAPRGEYPVAPPVVPEQ